jgi:hypothetical protein
MLPEQKGTIVFRGQMLARSRCQGTKVDSTVVERGFAETMFGREGSALLVRRLKFAE